MRNKLILLGYLALFFSLVSVYDLYKDNVDLVALVAGILTFDRSSSLALVGPDGQR
jgi:hypothetical protein